MKVAVTRGGQTSAERDQLFQRETIEQELIRQGQAANLPVCLNLANILRQEIPENFLFQLSLPEMVENLLQANDDIHKFVPF